jgi:hypothetical protein
MSDLRTFSASDTFPIDELDPVTALRAAEHCLSKLGYEASSLGYCAEAPPRFTLVETGEVAQVLASQLWKRHQEGDHRG